MKLSIIEKTQYSSHFKRLMTWTAIFVVTIAIIFTYSKTASASTQGGWRTGLISFMNSILGSEQASAKIELPTRGRTSQTIALLQPAVNIDPNPSKPGETVPVDKNALVPDISASGESDSEIINTQISVYTVQAGDTLSGIAEMHHISVKTIMWSNDISKVTGIQPGQKLVILPVSGITYVVKSGDTLESIAKKYGGDHVNETLEDIQKYNDLTLSSRLKISDSILIPDAELETIVPTKPTSKANKISSGYFMRPIVGGVHTQGAHGNNAVDLASSYGANILASAAGEVIVSKDDLGWHGGYGKYIVVKHANGTQTVYAHLSATVADVGEYVTQGQVIGKMGNSGNVKGPTGIHLHFEIRNGPANPF